MAGLGRWILTLGLIAVGVGLLVMAAEKFSFFRLGRLPGDIVYRRKNVVIYIPLATSLLLSLVLTKEDLRIRGIEDLRIGCAIALGFG